MKRSVLPGGTTVCADWKILATLGSSTAVLVDASENSSSSGDWLPESSASFVVASFRPA